jgi:hypothetical protein
MASLRRFTVRDGAVVIAVLALIAAGSQAPKNARLAWSQVTAPSESLTNRELAAVIIAQDPTMFQKAASIIPRNATYSVVVGNEPPTSADFHELLPFLFQYWLLPRRYTPDIHKASWVISYSHSSETLGIPYSEELNISPTANVDKEIR